MSETVAFETFPMIAGLSGGAFITSAISFLNNSKSTMANKIIGMIMFSMGWAQIIASFDKNDTREDKYKMYLIISSVVAWASAMSLRMMMDSNVSKVPMMIFGLMFMSSWFVIGHTIARKTSFTDEIEDVEEEEVNVSFTTDAEIIEDVETTKEVELESDDMTMTRTILSVSGIMTPIMIFLAMMLVNKVERPGNIASGIGLPIFTSAWVVLSLTNSFILHE